MKFKSTMITFAMVPFLTYAAEEKAALTPDLEEHIKMHQTMGQAHHDAAACLQSGKSIDECRTAFHKTCGEAKAPGMCGMGSMGKGKRGSKKQ